MGLSVSACGAIPVILGIDCFKCIGATGPCTVCSTLSHMIDASTISLDSNRNLTIAPVYQEFNVLIMSRIVIFISWIYTSTSFQEITVERI